jgi:hypothetical protein
VSFGALLLLQYRHHDFFVVIDEGAKSPPYFSSISSMQFDRAMWRLRCTAFPISLSETGKA